MDYSPPGSSIHGILQARILEWVVIPFSRGPSPPRDWTCIFCIGRQILYHWATSKALRMFSLPINIWRIKWKQTVRVIARLKPDTHPSKVNAVVSLPSHLFNGRVMAEKVLHLPFFSAHGDTSASVSRHHSQMPGGVCRMAKSHQ